MEALTCAEQMSALQATLNDHEPTGTLADATLGAPVPRLRNCYGIGLNYAGHAAETGRDIPRGPVIFSKFRSCVVGPCERPRNYLRSQITRWRSPIVNGRWNP